MTETVAQGASGLTAATSEQAAANTSKQPGEAKCRHCGTASTVDAVVNSDWQCKNPECERYQDTMPCPTCKQPVRISLNPNLAAQAPAASAAKGR